MSTPLVVIGAGGFGREVLDVVDAVNLDQSGAPGGGFEVVAVLADPLPDLGLLAPYGVGRVGPVSDLDEMPADVRFVVGIGSPQVRARIVERAGAREAATLVHPTATIGAATTLGPGTVVCAGARVTNHVTLGRHVQVNLNATIGHDARLGDCVTVSPLVGVSGAVTVEAEALLGTGATINEGLTVGTGAVVGAGAAVVRGVDPGATVVGVPARPR